MKIIRMEATPNPSAIKFVLDEAILSSGSRQYDSAPPEQVDPLAHWIFGIPSVKSIFYMENFITIDKPAGPDWVAMELGVNQMLAEGMRPVDSAGASPADERGIPEGDNDEMLRQINEVLDAKIRPALAGDGGGLQVLSLRGNDLLIRYQGACGSCPSSIAGTMFAIQNLLRTEVAEQINVIAA